MMLKPIIALAGLSEMSGMDAFGFMLTIFAGWFLIPMATIQGPAYSVMTYAQPAILIMTALTVGVILRRRKTRMWIRVVVIAVLYVALTFGTNVFAFTVGHPRAFVSHVKQDSIRLLADARNTDQLASLLNERDQFGNEIGVFVEFENQDWIAILPKSEPNKFSVGAHYTVAIDSTGAWFENTKMSQYNGIATITNGHGFHRRPQGRTLEAVQAELLHQGFTRMDRDGNTASHGTALP
jgi:hypothetical protein